MMHMSNGEVSGLSQEDLADQGALSSQAPLISEVPTVVEAPNKKPTLKELLPPGYPRLLFHGTSTENAVKISTQGLALGTVTTNAADSLTDRFFRRSGGQLVIMEYKEDDFQTNTQPNQFNPYRYFEIKKQSMTPVRVEYDYVDTDQAAGSGEISSNECIPSDELRIVSLNPEQAQFLQNVNGLITAEDSWLFGQTDEQRALRYKARLQDFPGWDFIPASEGDSSGKGGDNYKKYFRQQEIGELLQFEPSDFMDFHTYQSKLHELYPTEHQLVERLASLFPGNLEGSGGGLSIDSQTIVTNLLRQMIQCTVVTAVCKVLREDVDTMPRLLYPDGEDAVGLRRLEQARQ